MSVKKRQQARTKSRSRPAVEPDKKSQDTEVNSDFIRYPVNKVVGIIDDIQDAQAALHDLQAAGFTAAQITVLAGEEGAHRIDVLAINTAHSRISCGPYRKSWVMKKSKMQRAMKT